MLPNQSNNVLEMGAGYVPYFYASGRFQWYDQPSQNVPGRSNLVRFVTYDFTSDLHRVRAYPIPQTVEDVIRKGYLSVPASELETALISDKKDMSKLGLSDVISQIRNRYSIYERNMYQIELGKCYTISTQLAVESDRGGVCMSSKEAYSLNKNLNEFYEQQREERNRLWADVSKLKLLLPEKAQNYLSSYRKLAILEEGNGVNI